MRTFPGVFAAVTLLCLASCTHGEVATPRGPSLGDEPDPSADQVRLQERVLAELTAARAARGRAAPVRMRSVERELVLLAQEVGRGELGPDAALDVAAHRASRRVAGAMQASLIEAEDLGQIAFNPRRTVTPEVALVRRLPEERRITGPHDPLQSRANDPLEAMQLGVAVAVAFHWPAGESHGRYLIYLVTTPAPQVAGAGR